MGQSVDEPTGGDAGHPGADERNALPAKKEPVVAIAQSADRELPRRDISRCFGWSVRACHWRLDDIAIENASGAGLKFKIPTQAKSRLEWGTRQAPAFLQVEVKSPLRPRRIE